ncbi:MAG: hypothetical protein DI628_05850 [Blastochloris viridis]|uniref:DUF4189 domain-containing protein n=1 Tax=Blastochloris viridis TaxID=1079 RepID=A0A6N4QYZ6_BLAVI|nr:MAG: hypothetical protein DI628_05850 [Blastochloris viridis]
MRLVTLALMANSAFALPLTSETQKVTETIVVLTADKQGLSPAHTYNLQGLSAHAQKDAIRSRCYEFQNCIPIASLNTGCTWVSIGPFRQKFANDRTILPNYGATYGIAPSASEALRQCNLYGDCAAENVKMYCAG